VYPIAVSRVPSLSASFVFLVSRSPTFPLVKSIVVVVVGVVVELVVVKLVVVDVLPDFFGDLVSALASFVWDVVVVFVGPDPLVVVVTFGPFVVFAVVVLGDGVDLGAVGAFEVETFTGAGPFPFEAAAIGASVRHRTIAVPTVISVMRMGFTSLRRDATEVPITPSGERA
jgi:hypothetical protein